MCLWMLHICMHRCTCVWGQQNPFLRSQLSLFSRQSSSFTWNSLIREDWLARESQDPAVSTSQGYKCTPPCPAYFCVGSGTRAQVLTLIGFDSLSHLSSPRASLLKCPNIQPTGLQVETVRGVLWTPAAPNIYPTLYQGLCTELLYIHALVLTLQSFFKNKYYPICEFHLSIYSASITKC